jgi:hypothetical protein
MFLFEKEDNPIRTVMKTLTSAKWPSVLGIEVGLAVMKTLTSVLGIEVGLAVSLASLSRATGRNPSRRRP